MSQFSQTGTTALPSESKYRAGEFAFRYRADKAGDPLTIDGSFRVSLYCTSEVSTAFDSTNWVKLSEAYYKTYFFRDPGSYSPQQTMNIDHTAWGRAKSIGINVGKPSDSETLVKVDPVYVYYSTETVLVYDSGEAIGQFFWLAADGGLKG